MRIRKKKWAEPELSVCDFFVKNPEEHTGNWKNAFKKEQPLYLEIGCGKGKFIVETAAKNLGVSMDKFIVNRSTSYISFIF